MPSSKEIREGLATNLRRVKDVQVSPYGTSSPTTPALQVMRGRTRYDAAMQRGADWNDYRVQGIVSFTSDEGSQVLLDELLNPDGARSVKAALEHDRTLGGKADSLRVTEAAEPRIVTRAGGGELLVVEWTVEVLISPNGGA